MLRLVYKMHEKSSSHMQIHQFRRVTYVHENRYAVYIKRDITKSSGDLPPAGNIMQLTDVAR